MLLSGPFTAQIHDAEHWQAWTAELGGGTVRLVWVSSDEATLRRRLIARGLARDEAKLAEFEQYCASMRHRRRARRSRTSPWTTGSPPPRSLAGQVAALARQA